ncbi:type VI secretion protein [Streptomyces sp. NPDC002835]
MYEGGREGQARREGGVPDGLLVGLLALLLGLTLLVWSATGLAGLFTHGSWPSGVTFTNTPAAIRSLAGAPQDLAAAWPATPPGELSGYGLFWGLLIGQLMVLIVLTVFTLGTVARWRAVRAAARAEARTAGRTEAREPRRVRSSERAPEPPVQEVAVPEAPVRPVPQPAPAPGPVADAAPETPTLAPPPAVPAPRARTPRVLYADPAGRRPAAVQALIDAEGPALVVTSDPAVWAETKDARAKLGPVLVYDPGHLCDTPARLHWSPTAHCEDDRTAAARAGALLAPVRPRALIDAAVADTAETLMRCWLHAAAVDGRPFRQVHRWAQGSGAHEPVRILRTHPKAAGGLAGLLESALTAHPERREIAQELTARALSALSSVHIREACTANRTDLLALESFVNEAGTLYVVGEPIEDPRTHPGAMPLLTALAADVVEHGRRMAARSSDGRLDPPMTLVLDDVAAVAPFPGLPELLATGDVLGMPALALLRSPEQARARWTAPLPQS